MSSSPVELVLENQVARLTLNRPDVLNAIDTALITAMRAALAEAVAAGARALVLTGAGRAFCTGADLNDPVLTDYGADKEEGSRRVMAEWIDPLVLELANLPIPTIAAVNGVTAGGGIGLALATDIVIAAEGARFLSVFVPRLGLVPDMGVSWHLTQAFGVARARAIMLLGEPVTAEEAAVAGLIWKTVPQDVLAQEAQALATRLAAGAPLAIARTRALARAALGNTLEAQIDLESRYQAFLNSTEDAAEGVQAFRDKREPRFTGR